MNNYSIEQIEKLRTHIIKIINNSEYGKYKNYMLRNCRLSEHNKL